MNEAAENGTSLLPAIVLGVYWAYLVFWRELHRSILPGPDASAPTPHPAGRTLPAPQSASARTAAAFDEAPFLEGACNAYEFILSNYIDGNLEALADLLDRAVFEAFRSEAGRRASKGRHTRLQMTGPAKAEIVDTEFGEAEALVTVRFDSEMFLTDTVAGEAGKAELVRAVDLWTFRKQHGSRSSVWVLVATDTVR